MIRKGCAVGGAVLLLVFGAYFALLRGKVELVPAVALSAFVALGLVMVVSQLKAVLFGSGDVAALKRAEQGLPLEDGREEAVWGPIEPMGSPLEAPFSGAPCVAYEYDAKQPPTVDSEGDSSPGASAFAGYALTPSVIRSSRGDVRLLGFNLLGEFPEQVRSGPEAVERASRHVGSAELADVDIAKIGTMVSILEDTLTDDDGFVRKDLRIDGASPSDLGSCRLVEKVVPPGETVTAIGIWDAAKGGLVPKHRGKTTVVKLLSGGGAAMVAHAAKRPWGPFLFAVVLAGVAHVVIWVALRHG